MTRGIIHPIKYVVLSPKQLVHKRIKEALNPGDIKYLFRV